VAAEERGGSPHHLDLAPIINAEEEQASAPAATNADAAEPAQQRRLIGSAHQQQAQPHTAVHIQDSSSTATGTSNGNSRTHSSSATTTTATDTVQQYSLGGWDLAVDPKQGKLYSAINPPAAAAAAAELS